jgi:hypothetical protein
MKSKKWIIYVVILNLFLTSAMFQGVESQAPKTNAVGDYTLGFEIDDYFEFVCTELDTTELNSVFGGDWASDVGDYMWWCGDVAPNAVGEKSKFAIVNITDHPSLIDWWRFTIDGWGWIDKINTFGVTPVSDDLAYSLPMNPTGDLWNPSVWIIAKPVDIFISNVSYSLGYSTHDNIINYTGTDVGDYEVNWIYDENTGVVKNFVIKNDADTIIFELWGFELKIQTVETYNWIVTELNAVILEDVFGVNWASDLNTYCWWALNAPSETGNKSKFEIDTVLNHPTPDWYRFYVDGWNWKDKELLHGVSPDRDDTWYNLPMDPTGLMWNPSLWMIPTPVATYLEELAWGAGINALGNIVTLSDTDVELFEAIWTYDEDLGVTDLFQIKNSAGTTIFEIILQKFIFPVGTEFEWEVTKLDAVELENVLGVNWDSDIQSILPHGPDCDQLGDKMKRKITEITLSGNLWYVYYDWWYWTTTGYSVEPNTTYSTGFFCDPEDGAWGGWMWCAPYPAYYYLVGRSYAPGTELSGLTVTQNGTDIEDYQLKCIYDEILCVYKTVQLLNDESTVIFEYRLISVVAEDGIIPGYDLFILISTMFLVIGFVSIIFYRKIKK